MPRSTKRPPKKISVSATSSRRPSRARRNANHTHRPRSAARKRPSTSDAEKSELVKLVETQREQRRIEQRQDAQTLASATRRRDARTRRATARTQRLPPPERAVTEARCRSPRPAATADERGRPVVAKVRSVFDAVAHAAERAGDDLREGARVGAVRPELRARRRARPARQTPSAAHKPEPHRAGAQLPRPTAPNDEAHLHLLRIPPRERPVVRPHGARGARAIARAGYGIVYGGGQRRLMASIADAALARRRGDRRHSRSAGPKRRSRTRPHASSHRRHDARTQGADGGAQRRLHRAAGRIRHDGRVLRDAEWRQLAHPRQANRAAELPRLLRRIARALRLDGDAKASSPAHAHALRRCPTIEELLYS